MPRDPAGIYSKPNPNVVPDTTIESAVFNSNTADVEQDLNNARPVVAGGTGGNSASAARDNLDAERSMQVVTNYDSHVWEAGSFMSAIGATNAPVAGHAFAGVVVVSDVNNIVVRAYDLNDTVVPGRTYSREKKAGVWSAWSIVDGSDRVLRAGDTMTGDLTISKTFPTLRLAETAAGQPQITSSVGGINRWTVFPASGPNANFLIMRHDAAGALLDAPIGIDRLTGRVSILSNPTLPLELTPKQYVDTNDATLNNAITALTTTVNGKVAKAGDTMTGDLTISKGAPTLILNNTGAAQRSTVMGQKSGLDYWHLDLGDSAGDLKIQRFNPPGTFVGTFLLGERATGNATFQAGLTCVGNITANGHTSRAGVGGATSNPYNFFWSSPSLSGWVDATNLGNITFSSDYRIKKDVVELSSMWATIKALRPVSYTQAAYGTLFVADDIERWGFVAHELQEATIENAATGRKDEPNLIQAPNPWTVLAALTKAVQEIMARVEALENA